MCIVITNYLTAMLTIGPCMDRVISHFPIEEKTCNLNQWTREVAILNTEVVLPYMVKSTESGQGISRYSYKHILPNHFFHPIILLLDPSLASIHVYQSL